MQPTSAAAEGSDEGSSPIPMQWNV